jgi:hypothetical protein
MQSAIPRIRKPREDCADPLLAEGEEAARLPPLGSRTHGRTQNLKRGIPGALAKRLCRAIGVSEFLDYAGWRSWDVKQESHLAQVEDAQTRRCQPPLLARLSQDVAVVHPPGRDRSSGDILHPAAPPRLLSPDRDVEVARRDSGGDRAIAKPTRKSFRINFKHLEDAVIPPLVPMARGFHFALDRESQQLLALWATKTAIALIAATDGLAGAVRIVHRRAVRENAEVPEGVWVGFFSWRGEPTIATSRFVSVDEGQVSAYGAVLAFTGVGFSVKGFERPEPAETLDGDAPNLDLTAIKDASARARGALRDGKATAASLLTAALAARDDPLLVG